MDLKTQKVHTIYEYKRLKRSLNHVTVLPHKNFNLMEVGICLRQDVNELQLPGTTSKKNHLNLKLIKQSIDGYSFDP